MKWQPGENFKPVTENCGRSWLDCPFALVHYIWFEAVTDVVDCLTNESILWNLLAILLVCGTISLLIYWRIQWLKEANTVKENLKRVNVKIQDLGLKVNILTYEIQYGTWTLPHISKENAKMQDIQIAISKLNEENSSIKHLLTSAKGNKYNRNGISRRVQSQSSSYDSNEYDITTREKNYGYNDHRKLSSSSENSLNSKSTNKQLRNEFNIGKLQPKLEQNFRDDELKFSTTPKDVRIISNIPPDFGEKILTFQKEHWNSKNAEENLHKIKNRLENLQLTLRRYSSSDLPRALVDPELRPTDSRYQYHCQTSIGMRNYLNVQDVSEMIRAYSSLDALIAKNQMSLELTRRATSDKHSDCQIETNHEIKKRMETLEELILVQDLKSYKTELATSLSEISNSNSNNFIMIDNNGDGMENSQNIHKMKNIEEIVADSQKYSLTEVEKESDSDDKSTNTLLEQALKFKKELLIQMISEKEKNEMNVKITEEQTNSQNYPEYQNKESKFQPKQLDMIVEESSGSSITAIKSKTNIPKTVERAQYLEEQYKIHNTFQQVSNNEILAYNKYLLESKILENEIMKQQIGTNMLINERVDTSEVLKSNCGEERDNSDDNINSEQVESLDVTENNSTTQSDTPENFSCDDDPQEIEYQNQNYSKANFNLGHLTETSSDTSVNRLLDQLIESERKCKSAKCSAESREKEFVVDSIHNFIDSHDFFQPAKSKNNEFDNFSMERDTEKNKSCERHSPRKLKNNQVNYGQNSITRSDEIGDDSPKSGGTVIDTVRDNNCKIEELNGGKEIFHNRKIFSLDSQSDHERDAATKDTALKTSKIKNEIDQRNIEQSMREQGSRQEKIIDKKDAGDFCSDDESSIEESYLHGDISNETSPNAMNSTQRNLLLCGDSMLSSQKKSKSNQYHASCVTPSVIFPQKNMSSNSVQKQPARSGFDLVTNKQLKGKSNSLTSVDKTRSTSSHKGSKSHVTAREIFLDVEDSKLEKKKLNGSLFLSCHKSCTLRDFQNEKDVRKTFEILPYEYPRLKISTFPKGVSINREENRCESECNKSFKSLIYSSDLPSTSHISLENFSIENENDEGNRRQVQGFNSGKLKFAKQNYDNSCLDERSLSIGLKNHEEVRGEVADKIENKNDKSDRLNEEMDLVSHRTDSIEMQYLQDAENSTIISVNTITENDEVVTNLLSPKQFKEYMENKIMDLQNITSRDNNGTEIVDDSQSLNLSQCHVFDARNSKTNISDCTDVSSMNSSLFQMEIFPPKPYLVNRKETEVMAKPCTADASTSVSDLSYIPIEVGKKVAEFKIFEVPEELTKEEYISLLQMINENPDLQQSTSMNDICHKLGLELKK